MPKSKPRDRRRNKLRPKRVEMKGNKESVRVKARPKAVVDFQRPDSNSRMEFTLIPVFTPGSEKSRIPRSPQGRESVYQVTYFLSIPGVDVYLEKVDLGKSFGYGTSLLQMPQNEVLILTMNNEENTDNVEIHFFPNKRQLLSHVRLRVKCNSFEEAERFAHERVSTVLSYWSFQYDIGIEIGRYEIIEETTGTRKLSFGVIGRVKPFNNDSPFQIRSAEYRRILAAYREAMTSTNLFYQSLSFFKVIEGTLNLRKRENRKNKTGSKGAEPFEADEVFPANLNDLPVESIDGVENGLAKIAFQKYLGKDFREVRDDLKEIIRNAVAHLGDFEKVIDFDRYDDVVTCARAIPVLKYMAQKMLGKSLTNN